MCTHARVRLCVQVCVRVSIHICLGRLNFICLCACIVSSIFYCFPFHGSGGLYLFWNKFRPPGFNQHQSSKQSSCIKIKKQPGPRNVNDRVLTQVCIEKKINKVILCVSDWPPECQLLLLAAQCKTIHMESCQQTLTVH